LARNKQKDWLYLYRRRMNPPQPERRDVLDSKPGPPGTDIDRNQRFGRDQTLNGTPADGKKPCHIIKREHFVELMH
jgi:hypothetical protein